MATAYTNLLGFALPVTGELAGTWGTVVNDSITELVEDSIAGTATASVASGDWTLSTTGSGAANEARCAILIPTGSPGVSRNIIAPSQSKAYVVVNQSDAAVVLKGAATTGVTIAAGAKALVAWNGSDFVQVGNTGTVTSVGGTGTVNGITLTGTVTSTGNLTLGGTLSGVDLTSQVTGTLPAANGGTGQASYTTGDLLYASGSTAISKLADVATGNALISGGVGVAPSWGKVGLTTHVDGTLPVANGGTGLTSGTSGGVLYYSATGTLASSSALAADNVVFGGGAGVAPSSSTLLSKSAAVTSGTYVKAIGYADTVVALGNTGTAINIDVVSGGVFTATLTGSCTFTLRYPVSSGSSSFTLILTNDGTSGRSVAWSGGTFLFPGGSGVLSRSTSGGAVDVWVFFTPNGGSTWYGNIAMKNMLT